MRIPLAIVIEGIQRAFENYRRKGTGRKLSSLSFCHAEVLKAFAQFRERGVGQPERKVSREGKRRKARLEAERFLSSLPTSLSHLQGVYQEAVLAFSLKAVDEVKLEALEEKAEALIRSAATEEERAEIEKRLQAEFGGRPKKEREEIFAIELVRFLREKYRIPHLSLFYY